MGISEITSVTLPVSLAFGVFIYENGNLTSAGPDLVLDEGDVKQES